jgi:hypothetical protein
MLENRKSSRMLEGMKKHAASAMGWTAQSTTICGLGWAAYPEKSHCCRVMAASWEDFQNSLPPEIWMQLKPGGGKSLSSKEKKQPTRHCRQLAGS